MLCLTFRLIQGVRGVGCLNPPYLGARGVGKVTPLSSCFTRARVYDTYRLPYSSPPLHLKPVLEFLNNLWGLGTEKK
jgi:hypothetical protein